MPDKVARCWVVRRCICFLWNWQHVDRTDNDSLAREAGRSRQRHGGPLSAETPQPPFFRFCAAIWLLILSERFRERLLEGLLQGKHFSQHFLSQARKRRAFAFLASFIGFMALLMLGSRAGVMVSLLTLVTAFTVFVRRD